MNQKCGRRLLRLVTTLVVLAFGILCIFPFIWMVSSSFKYEIDVMEIPIRLIPKSWNFTNYSTVWLESNFIRYFRNSILVTAFSLLGDFCLTTTAAYAFGRLRFRGKELLFALYLATMMVPMQITLIPKYIVFGSLGLNNTFLALILPAIFNAFGVFLMRGYFESVPMDFTEAAFLDGAGHFVIFTKIILPMVKPGVVTLMLLSFIWSWNDYMGPLIFLNSERNFTLTIGLQRFQESNVTHYALLMAGSVICILPLAIAFIFTQKYFVDGLAGSGIKG